MEIVIVIALILLAIVLGKFGHSFIDRFFNLLYGEEPDND